MYVNKCSKCGAEFETKNPKRVICPSCLYPDKNPLLKPINENPEQETQQEKPQQQNQNRNYQDRDHQNNDFQNRPPGRFGGDRSYGGDRPHQRPYNQNSGYNQDGFRRPPQQGGYNNQSGGYNQGGFRRPPQQGGYNNQSGGYNQGGFRRPPQQGGRPPFNNRSRAPQKQLLISREQVAQIEILYKKMLPLPNPDAHEIIAQDVGIEPNKAFFGINLVRQKMRLPKLPYPKRKLAVSADQLMAIENLYTPLLPLPPIGCHKIIAKQLKIDEWRVHVGIGIIRKQMELPRWNPDREDAPEEFKNQAKQEKATEA